MSKKFTVRFPVRFRDVDIMGHVNNAVYFTYMETARAEFWMSILDGKSLLNDLNFIVAHAECDFEKPAHFGDEIEVSIETSSFGNTSFVWTYEIRNAKNGDLFAVGKTVQVYYDHTKKKSSPVPEEIKEKLISW